MANTPARGYPLIVTGTDVNTWGGVVNTQIFTVIDQNFGGVLGISLAGLSGNVTVSTTNDEYANLVLSGAMTGDVTLQLPGGRAGHHFITNSTTGGAVIVATTAGGSTGSLAPANGVMSLMFNDGTNVTTPSFLPLNNFIAGLTISDNSGTPNTKIDVAAGQAADSTNAVFMSFTGAAKTINMAVNGAGGLDTGAITLSTWYAALLIMGPAGVSVMATLGAVPISPTMPAGYTYYRYIGSFQTDASAHIRPFTQFGQRFLRTTPINVFNAAMPGTATLLNVGCPTGFNVVPLLTVLAINLGTADVYSMISPPAGRLVTYATAGTPFYPDFNLLASGAVSGATVANPRELVTDTSGRVYHLVQAFASTPSAQIYNNGWIDAHVAVF